MRVCVCARVVCVRANSRGAMPAIAVRSCLSESAAGRQIRRAAQGASGTRPDALAEVGACGRRAARLPGAAAPGSRTGCFRIVLGQGLVE